MLPDQPQELGTWWRIRETLLDLFFPPRCVGCGRYGTWLCPECEAEIERITGPLCPRCGRSAARSDRPCPACRRMTLPIDGIRSAAYFEGALREAIHRFKYRGLRALAHPLGQLMAEQWTACHVPAEVIIPVPLHPSRLAERGYNQATLLARELQTATGLPVATESLVRIRATAPQVTLGAAARQENVLGAFRCCGDTIAGRQAVLVDDLCTTGATLSACSVALQEAGASSVWAYTLARPRLTIRRKELERCRL
jgi:ComF family protein